MNTINYENIIKQINDFPTLPTIYNHLLSTISNPRSSVTDVANIISQDISMSTKILKTVNSSVFSLVSKVETISDAVFHLGFNEVKNLVLSLSVINIFKNVSSIENFSIIDIWKHSLGVAVTTRNLGNIIGVKNLENYFLAGLIHDIGKLFFLKVIPNDYSKVIKMVIENGITIEEGEEKVLSINHREIGAKLSEKWQLPNSITNSIKYHDTGFIDGTANLQTACVHLANIISRTLELGFPGDSFVHKPNELIWDVIKLNPSQMKSIIPKINIDFKQSLSILMSN